MRNVNLVREMVQSTLERPHKHEWSIQGLGMLRMYFNDSLRLHIWDSDAVVPNASVKHTHPWSFTSHVIVGCMADSIFMETHGPGSKPYWRQTIKCGVYGGLVGDPEAVDLKQIHINYHLAGHQYTHLAEGIHSSDFDDGTVTLVKRTFHEDTEHAYVYWKENEEWGDALPRKATRDEIEAITQHSLNKYFN